MDIAAIFTDYIVPIVALIALGLSIYNTYLHRKESRPNISMGFSYVGIEYSPDFPSGFRVDSYNLIAENLGKVSVIIAFSGFNWNNDEYITKYYRNIPGGDVSEAFPFKLDSGSTLSIYFEPSEIEEEILKKGLMGLIKIKGFIKDGYGKYYTSSPLEIRVKKEKQ